MTRPQLEDPEKPLNRTGYAHLAFSVGSKEKVDELFDVLKKWSDYGNKRNEETKNDES